MSFCLLFVAAAGCFGDDGSTDEDDDHDHSDHDHGDGDGDGNMTDGNETEEPNEPPVVTLTMTDADGAETDTVLEGENLTFSAEGSSDPDGELESIAILVVDKNGTHPPAVLYQDGAFVPAEFSLRDAGLVSVSVTALDDDGAFAHLTAKAYVNDLQPGQPFNFNLVATTTDDADSCADPVPETGSSGAINNQMAAQQKVDVGGNATQIVATVAAGDLSIAICDPDGSPISDAGTDEVASDPGTEFTESREYYVMIYSNVPNNEGSQVDVLVRYDPLDDGDEEEE